MLSFQLFSISDSPTIMHFVFDEFLRQNGALFVHMCKRPWIPNLDNAFPVATFEVQAELDTPPQAKQLICKREQFLR